jgi:hypothetical protein
VGKSPSALREALTPAAAESADEAGVVDPLRAVLADPAQEAAYLAAAAAVRGRRLAAGLALHLAGAACQLHMVAAPEYDYDFDALGAPDLASGRAAARLILGAHLGAAAAAALVALALPGLRRSRGGQGLLAGLAAAHVAASVVAAARLPAAWGWLLVFPVELASLQSLVGGLPFRGAVALNLAALATLVGAAGALRDLGASAYHAVAAAVLGSGTALLARGCNVEARTQWRAASRYQEELRTLRRMLLDLLPAKVARQMLAAAGQIPPEECTAVVLQLDVCRSAARGLRLAPASLTILSRRPGRLVTVPLPTRVTSHGLWAVPAQHRPCLGAAAGLHRAAKNAGRWSTEALRDANTQSPPLLRANCCAAGSGLAGVGLRGWARARGTRIVRAAEPRARRNAAKPCAALAGLKGL